MGLYKRGSVWWMRFACKGRHYRKSTETDDRRLAKRIYDKVKGEIAEGKWFDVSKEEKRTFKDLMERYMSEHARPKKKSWLRDEISLSHLLPFFGYYTLEEVSSGLICRYKSRRLQEGAKPATLNRELSVAKHAFNLGLKEWEWCKENPYCKVKMERENNARDRVLGYDEEERLLDVCPKWLGEIVTFALHTGARMGEILELTWRNVDLFRRVVVIQQSKAGKPKIIPLTPTAMEVLKAKVKVRHINTSLVFSSNNATRISNRNLQRAFYVALKKAQVEGLRFHDLRHYAEFRTMPSNDSNS